MQLGDQHVAQLIDSGEFSQEELAAALNVSRAAVSHWLRGSRTPGHEVQERLARAVSALDAEGVLVDAGLRRGPVQLPAQLWEPAFSPRARFRLPLGLEWSGSAERRWRDARDTGSLLVAYTIVMVEGRVGDMLRWIDPKALAAHADEVIWPRGYEPIWRNALHGWEL